MNNEMTSQSNDTNAASAEHYQQQRRSGNSADAFSSSSEEEDTSDDDEYDLEQEFVGQTDNSTAASSSGEQYISEFDKALSRGGGKPSKGHAKSFFPKQPFRDSDTMDGSAGSYPQHRPPPVPSSASNDAPSGLSVMSGSTFGAATTTSQSANTATSPRPPQHPTTSNVDLGDDEDTEDFSSGVLPDVLMTMRQKIESLSLFDSDMMKLADDSDDPILMETRESLKRSSQQSISAAVLVSLAHKRYERRRLAAMEIEKVIRSLVDQNELERVRAILLLLSDDYVRSTSEDARKGGVVALAASAIGLKKAPDSDPLAQECRDLILAAVVHACQDHSQRVRYYSTESLFNVVKVIPVLAVQHFFILFEILRSLYADVDADVRSGAELLDKKLKVVIVGAINSGSFTADACVPVFARFVYMRNKATKRLTISWLQELNEKLIGLPILEFLHLFLGGIFDMIADPTLTIRQSALAFLQSVLPKLLVVNSEEAIEDMEASGGLKVNFDKILQSLVTTMEHPDAFVRKVAMYWMSRIVKAYMSDQGTKDSKGNVGSAVSGLGAARVSVRNSLPHMLPGILLSIGDTYHMKSTTRDSFLPDQTTHGLANKTNKLLQEAVSRDGKAYVQHLDGFIVALRDELDSPGGLVTKTPLGVERKPYRMDVKHDGTGIESQGFFPASDDAQEIDEASMIQSRLCALHWIIVLYDSVVPDDLKAAYAQEFVIPIINQLIENPPEEIVFKSLQVLAIITVPTETETSSPASSKNESLSGLPHASPAWATMALDDDLDENSPLSSTNVKRALDILDSDKKALHSRDRGVFAAIILLHSYNQNLIADLSRLITFMCRLQPPEFIFVSFAAELEKFVRTCEKVHQRDNADQEFSRHLEFVSAFVQQMSHVLLNADEAKSLRVILKDCIGDREATDDHLRKVQLFRILLETFAHNLVAATSLCLWVGAYRSASLFLNAVDPLDINLMLLLGLDKLIETIERPIFRHLHVRMLDCDKHPLAEGSGTMLFLTLKSVLMILPQSKCYNILQDRLVSTSRFRQTVLITKAPDVAVQLPADTEMFVTRVLDVRRMHCEAMWRTIRADSLEVSVYGKTQSPEIEEGVSRREWLGYESKEAEQDAKLNRANQQRDRPKIEELSGEYSQLANMSATNTENPIESDDEAGEWQGFWSDDAKATS